MLKRIVIALAGVTVAAAAATVTVTASAQEPAAEAPRYGTDGNGNPQTDDCTVITDAQPQRAVDAAADGEVVCVEAGDYSEAELTVGKAITVRANGVVKLRNIDVTGRNATIDGFTVAGNELGDPSTGIKFSGSGHEIVNNLVNGRHIEYAIACDSDECADDVRIAHNSVTGTHNFGVYLWGGENITVEWNNIYDLWMEEANEDVDGMRIWGSGHLIRNNHIHDLNAEKGEGEPHAEVPAINAEDFTVFRDRARLGDEVVDSGSPPNSPGFTSDVDGAARVRGDAVDIGPFEFA